MKLIRDKCCCFTGHRQIPAGEGLALRRRLREEILRQAEEGVDTFLAGGALGFDTAAAQEVLRLKEEQLPGIHLVLVLPCLGQEALWSRRDAEIYRGLIRRADETIYTGDVYDPECMAERNRYLVDHSSRCICYLTSWRRGGTAQTVRYALRQGIPVVNLAEKGADVSGLPDRENGQLSL